MEKEMKGKKYRMYVAQLGRCAYCGDELVFAKRGEPNFGNGYLKPTYDHIIPKVRGGTNDMNNLVLVHGKCNITKADYMPEEIIKLFEGMKTTFVSRGLIK